VPRAQRYFLTGGVDYLLDERSDTWVFHSVVKKWRPTAAADDDGLID